MLDFSFPSALNSKLVVRNLSRIHHHTIYTCQASNFRKKAISTNVTIELYLRPLSVEILFGNQPLSADRRYEVQCQTVGSRPPGKITWWMSGVELKASNVKVSSDGNVSLSTLNFTPTRQDHGKTLVCRATNELVKRGMKETSMKLNSINKLFMSAQIFHLTQHEFTMLGNVVKMHERDRKLHDFAQVMLGVLEMRPRGGELIEEHLLRVCLGTNTTMVVQLRGVTVDARVVVVVSSDGNVSLSTLNFTPTRQDHGKTLVCRATNELVKRGMKETSMKLNVFYWNGHITI
uniref:Ig-like domain-containing protein n=1 Tax=Lutzomyia longipalpis TaxID=7200 RepID=A0A1B0GHI9_LUTLO